MRGWSISLGRYFGVEVRLHAIFVLSLPVVMVLASLLDGSGARGLGLWLLLLSAVIVREVGHALATASAGYPVDQLVLLPTGSAPSEEKSLQPSTRSEQFIALAGPLSNFAVGITMALLMFAATPAVKLFAQPWVTPMHLLRSAIWAQILLGGLHLVPAWPLDAGVVLRRKFRRIRGNDSGVRASTGLSHALALVLIILGAALTNAWLIVMGSSLLLSSRGDTLTRLGQQATSTITAAEVMLTEFATLSASDTLEDALRRSVHSMQDVFPVVRGPVLVGSIHRDTLAQALRADGNGYVQGAMTRTVEVVSADDLLLPALQRMERNREAQLVSVIRDEKLVGILTPTSLSQSMSMLGNARRVTEFARSIADE